jgi:hypothetical protein
MATIFRQKVVSNNVTFNSGVALPVGATNFGLDIMDGWKDTGDPEESLVELGSYRDGSSSASFYPIRSKFLNLGGYVTATNVANAEALADKLVRDCFPRNTSFRLERYEAVPKYMSVRRSSAIEFDWTVVPEGFRWSTTLVAEDPFRYELSPNTIFTGVANTASGGHTFPVTFPMTFNTGGSGTGAGAGVYNSGSVATSNFTISLFGPLSKGGWRISNDTTGQAIGFNVSVPSGTDTLVIDFLNQVATVNGFAVSSDYFGDFWQLVPGNNTIRLYAEYDPSASATINYFSAWE